PWDSGVIPAAGMVYFDVRPASCAPTVELRLCDSCPSVDTVVLIAGLFRALVAREAAHVGTQATMLSPTVGRAALWRAARSGLEGDVVDVTGPVSRSAAEVVGALVDSLRPQLEQTGDWDMVSEMSRQVLAMGTSSARERRALRRPGRLADVVDELIAETASSGYSTATAVSDDQTLLFGYRPGSKQIVVFAGGSLDDSYDEAVDAEGRPRQHYRGLLHTIARLGVAKR